MDDDPRLRKLRQRQVAGLLLLALVVLLVALIRARHGSVFPPGWWR